jgi:hypothetical protein
MLIELTEEYLLQYLEENTEDEFSFMENISNLMIKANELKEHGLTPVFLYDTEQYMLILSSEEKLSKKIH